MKQTLIAIFASLYITSHCLAADSAVIIMYHRFGESQFPSTNIRIEQLEDHIRELTSGPYTVMPVLQILSRIIKGVPLPNKTIGISIDDGFKSIFTEAWPRLRKARLPFTIFISTDPVDGRYAQRLSWSQIREMRRDGVVFGAHTASHIHMANSSRKLNEAEINKSNDRFSKELGVQPKLFAYPFGEASTEVFDAIRIGGYEYAFGQHSGVVNDTSNRYYLPRFALNEKYGDLNRFKLVINALPIPVSDFTPSNPLVTDMNPPQVGFTVNADIHNLRRIKCFTSSEGNVSTTLLGKSRVEVRMARPFAKGRTRLNCTMPGDKGRWHWLGAQFVVPRL